MEDFVVTCQLVPTVQPTRSGSCTSPRTFGLGFLQTPPHDDALALLLAFGSSYTWLGDSHPDSSAPCPAHTLPSAARFSASAVRRGSATSSPRSRNARGTARRERYGPLTSAGTRCHAAHCRSAHCT